MVETTIKRTKQKQLKSSKQFQGKKERLNPVVKVDKPYILVHTLTSDPRPSNPNKLHHEDHEPVNVAKDFRILFSRNY